jgi:hypothetical protein
VIIYRVEFFKDDKIFHTKEWDFGLDSAKQHASGMMERYGATFARVVDPKGREVYSYPSEPLQ